MRIKSTIELTSDDIREAVSQWLSGCRLGSISAEQVKLQVKEGCMTSGANGYIQATIEICENEEASSERTEQD